MSPFPSKTNAGSSLSLSECLCSPPLEACAALDINTSNGNRIDLAHFSTLNGHQAHILSFRTSRPYPPLKLDMDDYSAAGDHRREHCRQLCIHPDPRDATARSPRGALKAPPWRDEPWQATRRTAAAATLVALEGTASPHASAVCACRRPGSVGCFMPSS